MNAPKSQLEEFLVLCIACHLEQDVVIGNPGDRRLHDRLRLRAARELLQQLRVGELGDDLLRTLGGQPLDGMFAERVHARVKCPERPQARKGARRHVRTVGCDQLGERLDVGDARNGRLGHGEGLCIAREDDVLPCVRELGDELLRAIIRNVPVLPAREELACRLRAQQHHHVVQGPAVDESAKGVVRRGPGALVGHGEERLGLDDPLEGEQPVLVFNAPRAVRRLRRILHARPAHFAVLESIPERILVLRLL